MCLCNAVHKSYIFAVKVSTEEALGLHPRRDRQSCLVVFRNQEKHLAFWVGLLRITFPYGKGGVTVGRLLVGQSHSDFHSECVGPGVGVRRGHSRQSGWRGQGSHFDAVRGLASGHDLMAQSRCEEGGWWWGWRELQPLLDVYARTVVYDCNLWVHQGAGVTTHCAFDHFAFSFKKKIPAESF